MRIAFDRVAGFALLLLAVPVWAQDGAQGERLVEVDAVAREVRVACEALRVDIPLEFVCVVTGTADHESLLRTRAKPSAVHAALLALGLEPGRPLRFSEAADRWLPPSGPPLRIEVEWTGEEGQRHRERVGQLLRHIETGQPMPPRTFVFVGSQIYRGAAGDSYAADATGQVVSLVNFEYPTIDVADLKSNANETLEWEINPDVAPPEGTAVTMILRPLAAGAPATQPTTQPAAPVDVVLVAIDADGTLRVEHEPIDLDDLAIRVRAHTEADVPAVRVSAARGAPVAVVGRVFGRLVEAGFENVTFVLPRRAETQPATGQPIRVRVSDAGRQVAIGGGEAMPLGAFVRQLTDDETTLELSQPITIEAASPDVRPVHLAAPAAALHVLGYGPIAVESPKPTSSGRLEALRAEWEQRVLPHSDELRAAAQTHYEVMQAYQEEINRLLDEADRLRREMDALQQRFDEMTTPQPTLNEAGSDENGANDDEDLSG